MRGRAGAVAWPEGFREPSAAAETPAGGPNHLETHRKRPSSKWLSAKLKRTVSSIARRFT